MNGNLKWNSQGIAEEFNERIYVIVKEDQKYKLTWNTRSGIMLIGLYNTMTEAKEAAENHHEPK